MSAFDKAGLRRLHAAMARHVDGGYLPGAVMLVSRQDEVHAEAIGVQSLEDRRPMARDTIFRIASMTKPISAAAAMILVEEGRLRLDDPVDVFLPEIAERRVLRSLDGPIGDTVPAERPISLRDLLTFRMGHGAIMAEPGTYPIQKALEAAGLAVGPEPYRKGPDEYMKQLGALPLLEQPGTVWRYHTGAEVLGVLVARASGKSFGEFLEERIFRPLGMKDTGFSVPEEKRARFASAYRSHSETGAPHLWDDARTGLWAGGLPFESGGGGLVSTADDYLAFQRMLLGKGRLGRDRILSRASVELMTSDQITPAQREAAFMFFGEAASWGYGMAVVIKRTDLFTTPGRFGWDGGYGTSAHADPANDMIGIFLTQRMMDSPEPPKSFMDFWTLAYAALN